MYAMQQNFVENILKCSIYCWLLSSTKWTKMLDCTSTWQRMKRNLMEFYIKIGLRFAQKAHRRGYELLLHCVHYQCEWLCWICARSTLCSTICPLLVRLELELLLLMMVRLFCNDRRLLTSKSKDMVHIFTMRHRFRCCICVCLFVYRETFLLSMVLFFYYR